MNIRIRPLLAALAVALAIPVAASADPGDKPVALEKKSDKAKKKRPRGEEAQFPMSGDDFMARINKRLDMGKEHLERRLEKSDASDAKKDEVRAAYTAAAGKIRTAAKKAAADDEVTRAEAKEVRKVAREAHMQMKGKHGKKGDRAKNDKRKNGKGKQKGKKA